MVTDLDTRPRWAAKTGRGGQFVSRETVRLYQQAFAAGVAFAASLQTVLTARPGSVHRELAVLLEDRPPRRYTPGQQRHRDHLRAWGLAP